LDGLQHKKHRKGEGRGKKNEMKNKNRFPEEEMMENDFFMYGCVVSV